MKALLLLLALAVFATAQSPKEGKAITDWTFVSEGPLIRSYFAPETIRRGGDTIKVWMRFEMPQGSREVYRDTPIDFGETRLYALMNCSKNQLQAKTMIVYDRNGGYFADKKNVSGWATATPNTIGYSVFEYFCERETTNPVKPTLKPK